MGTSDEWREDGSPAGGVGTTTRPAAGSATDPAAAPGTWRGGAARPATGLRVPPQRAGRPRRRVGHDRRALASDGPSRRSAEGTPTASAAPAAVSRHTRTMPFFLLLCGLLGGALICALVISTTLAEGSFRITRLQQADNALAKQRQLLQDEDAAAQSAQSIEQLALQLGMRPVGELRFLDLKTGKVKTDAGTGAVRAINVPGYTP